MSVPALCARQINPNVSSLALYDVQGTAGVAADISHINSKAQVKVRHGRGQPPVHKGFSHPVKHNMTWTLTELFAFKGTY